LSSPARPTKSAQPGVKSGGPAGSSAPPKTAPKLNRAQIQAMEVRTAETVTSDEDILAIQAAVAAPSARSVAITKRKVVPRAIYLTKAQEYAYIRADVRRLIITAGSLFALMIVILFIVEH
jgi:hypothetical protein